MTLCLVDDTLNLLIGESGVSFGILRICRVTHHLVLSVKGCNVNCLKVLEQLAQEGMTLILVTH